MFFGQSFSAGDVPVIGLLVLLEGVLSIDNALVLGLLARRLPQRQQGRALAYGLVGAFAFRLAAVATASLLMEWRFVKLLGGGYLLYVGARHLAARRPADAGAADASGAAAAAGAGFWATVVAIELTDVAFAADSILAAIALVGASARPGVGPHPKLWVVVAGGMIGVVLMRFAAVTFIRLLRRFPRFELAAYLLVLLIGAKLALDWAVNSPAHPHRLDFHSHASPAFWAFWGAMALCLSVGFLPARRPQEGCRPAGGPGAVASRGASGGATEPPAVPGDRRGTSPAPAPT